MSPSVTWVWVVTAIALAAGVSASVLAYADTYGLKPSADTGSTPAQLVAGAGPPSIPPENPHGAMYLDTKNAVVYYWNSTTNVWVRTGAFGGERGAAWYTEDAAPPATGPATARPGDYWLHSPDGDVYRASYNGEDEIVWTLAANIRGGTDATDSSGEKWFHGEGAPTSETGAAHVIGARRFDFYFDTDGDTIYQLDAEGSTWNIVSESGTTGALGTSTADGSQWYVTEDLATLQAATYDPAPREGIDYALVLQPSRSIYVRGDGAWDLVDECKGTRWFTADTTLPSAGMKDGDMCFLYTATSFQIFRYTTDAWVAVETAVASVTSDPDEDEEGIAPFISAPVNAGAAAVSGRVTFPDTGGDLTYPYSATTLTVDRGAGPGSLWPGYDAVNNESGDTVVGAKGHIGILWWAGDNGEHWNWVTTCPKGHAFHRDTLRKEFTAGATAADGVTDIHISPYLASKLTYILVVHSCNVGALRVIIPAPKMPSYTLAVKMTGSGTGSTTLRVEGVAEMLPANSSPPLQAVVWEKTVASGPVPAQLLYDSERYWDIVPLGWPLENGRLTQE